MIQLINYYFQLMIVMKITQIQLKEEIYPKESKKNIKY